MTARVTPPKSGGKGLSASLKAGLRAPMERAATAGAGTPLWQVDPHGALAHRPHSGPSGGMAREPSLEARLALGGQDARRADDAVRGAGHPRRRPEPAAGRDFRAILLTGIAAPGDTGPAARGRRRQTRPPCGLDLPRAVLSKVLRQRQCGVKIERLRRADIGRLPRLCLGGP